MNVAATKRAVQVSVTKATRVEDKKNSAEEMQL